MSVGEWGSGRIEMVGTKHKSYFVYWEINTFVKVKPHDPYCVLGSSKSQSVPKDREWHTGESQQYI